MLNSTAWKLYAPRNMHRSGVGDEMVRDGWQLKWAGEGTFKELSTGQSTRELGMAGKLTATARTLGIPAKVKAIPGSWQVLAPDGTWYEINNRTRTGSLLTLSLTEADDQHGGGN